MFPYVYLVNRFTLGNRTDKVIDALQSASELCHRDYEILINETPGEAEAAARSFRDTKTVVTAIGGDGSINLLLNILAGGRSILSFIPYGTGNDFSRACRDTLDSGIQEVDLVRINDRYFINTACFGIDADIANDDHFIHNPFIPGPLRYHAGVLYHFLTWKNGRRMKIEWDGRAEEGAFTTIVAANGQYYGGGYRVSPESRMHDGMLEVILVKEVPRIRAASLILSMKKAGHLKDPAVQLYKTQKLVISSEAPFTANIDGESLRAGRFELEMIPGGIRLDYDRAFLHEIAKRLKQ